MPGGIIPEICPVNIRIVSKAQRSVVMIVSGPPEPRPRHNRAVLFGMRGTTQHQPLRSRRRWPRRVAVATIAVLVFVIGLIAWMQPTLAAFVCPQCFGFERLNDRIFVERTMAAEQRETLQTAFTEAEQRLRAAYGALQTDPIVLACGTDTCWRRLGGGGSRGGAFATFGLRLSPRGLDAVIISHERSHVELHRRIGLWRFVRGAVPSWFDEGFAVIVSDDERYLFPPTAGDRCRTEPGGVLPSNMREWPRQAGADNSLYARAACRVSRWMARNGGWQGVLGLLDRVHAGERFTTVFAD